MGRLALRGVEGGRQLRSWARFPPQPVLLSALHWRAPHLERSRTRNTDDTDTLALAAAPHKPVCGLLENTISTSLAYSPNLGGRRVSSSPFQG